MSDPVRTRRPIFALWLIFFVNGAVLASWAPRIPQVKSELSLSDGQIGLVLLGVAAGSVPALLGTARLLLYVSARRICITSCIAFSLALPLIALAPNGWALGGALAALGCASGSLDVAMNTAAIDFQDRTGKRVLSRLHGGYSLGVLAGSASGALASALELGVLAHFVAVSACLTALAVVASRSLPSTGSDSEHHLNNWRRYEFEDGRHPHALAIPVSIAVTAIAALLVEGMVTDWSALLVARDFAGGDTIGALAVVAFSSAMFLSRSFGDHIVGRLGTSATLRGSAAVIAMATLGGVLLQNAPWNVVLTMGAIGAALGPVFPTLISEAGRRSRGHVAVATAQVSAVGYGAYLGGPPLVGLLAEHIGLRTAFVCIACACALTLAAASIVLRHNSVRAST